MVDSTVNSPGPSPLYLGFLIFYFKMSLAMFPNMEQPNILANKSDPLRGRGHENPPYIFMFIFMELFSLNSNQLME